MDKRHRIPRSFEMGCHTIRVRVVDAETMHAVDVAANNAAAGDDAPWGLWVNGENAIFVQKVRTGFNADQQWQTLWHEYFHALFDVLASDALSSNEQLVDLCGTLHAQALRTTKYT